MVPAKLDDVSSFRVPVEPANVTVPLYAELSSNVVPASIVTFDCAAAGADWVEAVVTDAVIGTPSRPSPLRSCCKLGSTDANAVLLPDTTPMCEMNAPLLFVVHTVY